MITLIARGGSKVFSLWSMRVKVGCGWVSCSGQKSGDRPACLFFIFNPNHVSDLHYSSCHVQIERKPSSFFKLANGLQATLISNHVFLINQFIVKIHEMSCRLQKTKKTFILWEWARKSIKCKRPRGLEFTRNSTTDFDYAFSVPVRSSPSCFMCGETPATSCRWHFSYSFRSLECLLNLHSTSSRELFMSLGWLSIFPKLPGW